MPFQSPQCLCAPPKPTPELLTDLPQRPFVMVSKPTLRQHWNGPRSLQTPSEGFSNASFTNSDTNQGRLGLQSRSADNFCNKLNLAETSPCFFSSGRNSLLQTNKHPSEPRIPSTAQRFSCSKTKQGSSRCLHWFSMEGFGLAVILRSHKEGRCQWGN